MTVKKQPHACHPDARQDPEDITLDPDLHRDDSEETSHMLVILTHVRIQRKSDKGHTTPGYNVRSNLSSTNAASFLIVFHGPMHRKHIEILRSARACLHHNVL